MKFPNRVLSPFRHDDPLFCNIGFSADPVRIPTTWRLILGFTIGILEIRCNLNKIKENEINIFATPYMECRLAQLMMGDLHVGNCRNQRVLIRDSLKCRKHNMP